MGNIAKTIEHTIVHIEDDAANWQPLTILLHGSILEYLGVESPLGSVSLSQTHSDGPDDRPIEITITWSLEDTTTKITYWLVRGPTVDGIKDRLNGQENITFVLDVMRPKKDSGLTSSLKETLVSINPYVRNQSEQVRLFTAYSQADGVEFPPDAPEMYKKGLETQQLLNFLMDRIGLGGH